MKKYDNLVIELIGDPCSGKSSSQEIMIDALQKEYPDIKKAQEAIDLYVKNLFIIKLLQLFPSFIFIFITRLVKSYLMIYNFILSFQSYSTLHKFKKFKVAINGQSADEVLVTYGVNKPFFN